MAKNPDRMISNIDQIVESSMDNGCEREIVISLRTVSERISAERWEHRLG